MLNTIKESFGSNNKVSLPEHISTDTVYAPEENPFKNIIVDITHRCNMECLNCYLPNRQIPDLDKDWLYDILSRLPQRTWIRLSGGEPTVRNDLPEIARAIKKLGHHPILMTNGLRLADRRYVQELKESGLKIIYLAFNGGFDAEASCQMESMRCLDKKIAALENLCLEKIYISLGIILVRNVNDHVLPDVWQYLMKHRQVRELHIRSVARFGRFVDTDRFNLDEMINLFNQCKTAEHPALAMKRNNSMADFKVGKLMVQITHWPDLKSEIRGRLAPDGTIQPWMEHAYANEGGY